MHVCTVGYRRRLASWFSLLSLCRTCTFNSAVWQSQSLCSAGLYIRVLHIGCYSAFYFLKLGNWHILCKQFVSCVSEAWCRGCCVVVAMVWGDQGRSALCTLLLTRSVKVMASCTYLNLSVGCDVSAARPFSTRNSSSSATMLYCAMPRMCW